MKTSIKISLKSFFVIFLSLMISNVLYASEIYIDGNDVNQIEIEEEEEEKEFFHSNSTVYQNILISDGGNESTNTIGFVESTLISFPFPPNKVVSFDAFSNESFHTPLYIKFCSLKAHIG